MVLYKSVYKYIKNNYKMGGRVGVIEKYGMDANCCLVPICAGRVVYSGAQSTRDDVLSTR